MIKTLRYAFVAALMMVAGAVNAQTAKAAKTEKITIDFYDYYKDFDKQGTNKDVVYLGTPLEQCGVKIVFDKSTGSAAPNVTFYPSDKINNPTVLDKAYVKLFGGDKENVAGNKMTFSSETKKIVSIRLVGTNATDWGEFSASAGTVTFEGNEKNSKLTPVWSCDEAKTGVSDVTFTISRSDKETKANQVRYVRAVVEVLNDASGINNITVDNAKKGVRYNLAGQRVNESYKGVVIENGKKMIVK